MRKANIYSNTAVPSAVSTLWVLQLVDVSVADATLWRGNLDLRNGIEKIQYPDADDPAEKMHLLNEYRQQFV